jgi:hypothetical protein
MRPKHDVVPSKSKRSHFDFLVRYPISESKDQCKGWSADLQEGEGIGRAAKVDYCQTHGHWVTSKQHDGIVAGATQGMDAVGLRCCESHVHDPSLPVSRVVAPSRHHVPIMP